MLILIRSFENKLYPSNRIKFCTQFSIYEGWNFNSGNYLFTTDTK